MKRLNEFYGFQSLATMPQDIEFNNVDKSLLSKLKWEDITMLEPEGEIVGSKNIYTISFDLGDKLNHLLPGIVFKIEQDHLTELNQPHIQLTRKLHRQGLATKLYRLILEEFGHLVSKKSKRFSDKEITMLYNKLSKDTKIDFIEKNGNYLLLHKKNREYLEKKNTFLQVS